MRTNEPIGFVGPHKVEIHEHRWYVEIIVTPNSPIDGHTERPVTYIASADRSLTEGDGIWFGTEADLAEAGQ